MYDEQEDDGRSTPVAERVMSRRKGHWPVLIAGDHGEHVAIDLSAGGLFLRDVSSFARGDRLELTLALRDGPLKTAATVRWVRSERQGPMMEAGMGVLFDGLSDADRARIMSEIHPGEY